MQNKNFSKVYENVKNVNNIVSQLILYYYLIKANNPDITDEEITSLLTEAKNAADSGKTVNNGKGIDIGYIDNEDNYQYQVIRLYE